MICFDAISSQRAIFLLFLFIIKRTAVFGFDFFFVQKRKKDSRFGQHPKYNAITWHPYIWSSKETLLIAQQAGRYQFSLFIDGGYGSGYYVQIMLRLNGNNYQYFRYTAAHNNDSGYLQTEIQLLEDQKVTFYIYSVYTAFNYYSHPYSFIEGKRTR